MKSINDCIISRKIEDFTQESIGEKIGITRIKTGFDEVDRILGGGLTPGLTVLGAASGLGKSTFILQVAENVSAQGIPVLYFSLEMMSNMIAAKAINRQLFVNSGKKTDRRFSAMDLTNPEIVQQFSRATWKSIDKSRDIIGEKSKNLYVLDMERLSQEELTAKGIYQIVEKFLQEHKDGPKPLVIVDYLQILRADISDNRGDRQNVENCIWEMTKIHQKYKISVVLISSLSRVFYKQKVQQESFKETGGIEYSSDVLLGLSFCNAPSEKSERKQGFNIDKEKSKTPREVEISFLKHRYGVCGVDSVVKLHYYAKYDYFEEISKVEEHKHIKPSRSNSNIHESLDVPADEDSVKRVRSIGSGKYKKGENIL